MKHLQIFWTKFIPIRTLATHLMQNWYLSINTRTYVIFRTVMFVCLDTIHRPNPGNVLLAKGCEAFCHSFRTPYPQPPLSYASYIYYWLPHPTAHRLMVTVHVICCGFFSHFYICIYILFVISCKASIVHLMITFLFLLLVCLPS